MNLTNNQLDKRLSSPKNLANRFSKPTEVPSNVTEIPIHKVSPLNGNVAPMPQFVRNTMAILSGQGEPNRKVANNFGIAHQSVSKCNTGETPAETEKVERALGKIRDSAMDRLMNSLGLLTKDKMKDCKATDLSRVASDMSKVVEKTLPRDRANGDGANIVIYAPQIRDERKYQTVIA